LAPPPRAATVLETGCSFNIIEFAFLLIVP